MYESEYIRRIYNNIKSRVIQYSLNEYKDGNLTYSDDGYYKSTKSFSIEIYGEKVEVFGYIFLFDNTKPKSDDYITDKHWDNTNMSIYTEIWYDLNEKKVIQIYEFWPYEVKYAVEDIGELTDPIKYFKNSTNNLENSMRIVEEAHKRRIDWLIRTDKIQLCDTIQNKVLPWKLI